MRKVTKKTLSIMLSLVTLASAFTSMPVHVFADESEQETQQYILGDVDLNGKVTLKDASLLQKYVAGLESLSDKQMFLGNVDKSEMLSLKDSSVIQRYIAKLDNEYPANVYGYTIGDMVDFNEIIDSDTETETDIDTTDTESETETDTVTTDTESEIETDTVTTDTESEIDTDTITTDTESEIDTDSITTDTESEIDTDTITTDTESETDTDSDTPVEVLPLEEIRYNLNGDFERVGEFAENWTVPPKRSSSPFAVESGAGKDGTNCLKISNSSQTQFSYIANYLTGLEPGGEYKLTVQVKGENIEATSKDNGAFLQVGAILGGGYAISCGEDGTISQENESYGRGYLFDCYNSWLNGTFDWQQITVYFEANGRGCADVICALDGSGTAYFDNIVIERVNYQEEPNIDKIKLVGEHIGMIMYKEDVAEYSYDQLMAWVKDIDWAYEQMAELMGDVPFGGDTCYFLASDEPYVSDVQAFGALNPIKWKRGYMTAACKRFCDDNVYSGVAYHELAHDFDNMYRPWTFNLEVTAEYKKLYVLLQKDGGVFNNHGEGYNLNVDDFPEYIRETAKYSYENTIVNRDGKYHYDNVNYVLYRISETVGWDVVKAVFRDFSEYYDPLYTLNVGKFNYFLICLQNKYNEMHPDATGFEVYDTFPEGELEYVRKLINDSDSKAGYSDRTEENIFSVQFVDATGERLWFEFVPRGKAATAPTVSASEEYGEFVGWDKDISNVISDMVVVAQYENFDFSADVTVKTDSTAPVQGEVATVSVEDSLDGNNQYNIVVKRNGKTIGESGYSSDNTYKVILTKSGTYTVYAYIKTSDGRLLQSSIRTFDVQTGITVYYNGYSNPNIHYKIGTGSWTTAPGVAMVSQNDISGYTHKYTIAMTTFSKITCCFNDGNGNWDNNGGNDYSITMSGAVGIKDGEITGLTND